MSRARTLVLVRHGVTLHNVLGRWQGQSDQPLSEDGWEQVRRLANRVPSLTPRPTRLLSSDLSRALHTASSAFAPLGLEPEASPLLRERSFGKWEGLTRAEVRERYGDAVHPEGGEDWDQLWTRMEAASRWVLERTEPGSCTAVVGHGGSLKAFVAKALGFPLLGEDISRRLALGNASLSVVTVESDSAGEQWRLLRLNDTAHLEGLA